MQNWAEMGWDLKSTNKDFFKKKIYGPFLGMGLNCSKATEPLRWGSLLFTT